MDLRKADYERVRSDSSRFVIVPGHEVPDVETVIERNEGWAIVEKAPEVTGIVEELDPRTDGSYYAASGGARRPAVRASAAINAACTAASARETGDIRRLRRRISHPRRRVPRH